MLKKYNFICADSILYYDRVLMSTFGLQKTTKHRTCTTQFTVQSERARLWLWGLYRALGTAAARLLSLTSQSVCTSWITMSEKGLWYIIILCVCWLMYYIMTVCLWAHFGPQETARKQNISIGLRDMTELDCECPAYICYKFSHSVASLTYIIAHIVTMH